MIEQGIHVSAGAAAPESRFLDLQAELQRAVDADSPSFLLVVCSSETALGACQDALLSTQPPLGQLPQRLRVEDSTPEQISEFLDKSRMSAQGLLWIDGLQWNHGRPAAMWELLSRKLMDPAAGHVRTLIWLTPRNAIDLAHYAPALWARCQRAIEVTGSSAGTETLRKQVEAAWWAWARPSPVSGLPEKEPHPTSEVEAPELPESPLKRADLLLTCGILNWRNGHHERAGSYLRDALAAASEAQDKWKEAEVFNAIALVESTAGRIEQAIEAYRQAIQLAPGPIPAWNNLGNLLAKAARNEDAGQAYLKALESNPRDPVAWIGLGNVHLSKGELDHAAAAFRKSTRYMPDFAQAWNGLGDAYAAAGRIDAALEAYRRAIELDRGYVTPRLRMGSLLARQERYREAFSEYQQALHLDSHSAEAWYEFGAICLESGQLEEAAAAFRKSIELGATTGQAYSNLAIALARQGRYDEAVPLYQKSLELLPADRNAVWQKLADAYRVLDDYERALAVGHQVDEPDSPIAAPSMMGPMRLAEDGLASHEQDPPWPLSESDARRSQPGDAALKRANELVDALRDSEAANARGNDLFRRGILDEATEAYNAAIALHAVSGRPYANLALLYLTQGEFAKALLLYQRSLELLTTPQEAAVSWNGLGNVYRRANDYANAKAAYQKAAELDPETAGMRDGMDLVQTDPHAQDSDAWNDLGEALLKTGAYDEAIRAFRNAIELQPDSGMPHNNLGRVLAALGQHSRAVPFFKKAADLLVDEREKAAACNRLGHAYRRLNDQEHANEAFQRAAALSNEENIVLKRARLSLLGNCSGERSAAAREHNGGCDE